jgi:hypothetical protein
MPLIDVRTVNIETQRVAEVTWSSWKSRRYTEVISFRHFDPELREAYIALALPHVQNRNQTGSQGKIEEDITRNDTMFR